MNFLSIKNISDKYKKNPKSVQKALERGYLRGKKDSNGWWLINEGDATEYYEKPNSVDWQPVDYYVFHYGISRSTILQEIEMGKLEAKKYRCAWYINCLDWKKKISKTCCDKEFLNLFGSYSPQLAA